MPSENKTLERIQREIMDVMEREKELRNTYSNNNNINGGTEVDGEMKEKPPLQRIQSTTTSGEVNLNGNSRSNGNARRFATNPNTKGVMQKFFRARGKLNVNSTIKKSIETNNNSNKIPSQFVIPEFKPPKLVVEPGKKLRNGYIPVEERIRKEVQAAHEREIELRLIRRKSQPDFLDMSSDDDDDDGGDDDDFGQNEGFGLRATKSMAQLYDSCETLEGSVASAPPSLKPARSLAELCDVGDDEITRPQSLIMQFEEMILRNQQARN